MTNITDRGMQSLRPGARAETIGLVMLWYLAILLVGLLLTRLPEDAFTEFPSADPAVAADFTA